MLKTDSAQLDKLMKSISYQIKKEQIPLVILTGTKKRFEKEPNIYS